jgi:hypothetical protein
MPHALEDILVMPDDEAAGPMVSECSWLAAAGYRHL